MQALEPQAQAVARPPHVPESAVYAFDFLAEPAIQADAPARVQDIVRNAPSVFWTPYNGGQWVVWGYAAALAACRDPASFTVESVPYDELQAMMRTLPAGTPEPIIPLPNSIDPPRHETYRVPLQDVFSPRAMMRLKRSIAALAAELIEAVKPDGGCDFMARIAEPLPVTIFLQMFGLPVARQREYRDIVKAHFSRRDGGDHAETQDNMRAIAAVMRDTILEKRHDPGDDIISLLWRTTYNGKPATLADLENYCVMLFLAGLDTVMNGMGLGVLHLARDTAFQAELRAHPNRIPEATEELIRRYTFTLPMRYAARDLEFEGRAMKKGEPVLLFLPAADLDPAKFGEADRVDLERPSKTHIAFGGGPHRCLGMHLARIELQTLYEEMLARLPAFRLRPGSVVRYHGGHVWGPDEVQLVW